MFRFRKHTALIGMLALIALGPLCCAQAQPPAADTAKVPAEQDRTKLKAEIDQLNKQAKPFFDLFTKTTELVLPSVVSVATYRTMTVPENPFFDFGPFMNPFENPWEQPQQPQPQPQPRNPRQPREREYRAAGLGSGFVVDATNGYIVTNYHVVKDVKAEDIKVDFSDGRELPVEKVLADPNTDVAVLKVKPEKLVALEWADAEVQRGQWVLAVGSPMGFGSSVTSGIISAPSTRERLIGGGGERGSLRANVGPFAVEDYLQTDAPINPGNSGGPLVDMQGRVLGLNTLIVSSTQSSAGLGFAVPTRIARPVVEQLITKGKVVRGYLGVSIISPAQIDDQVAQQLFNSKTAQEVLDKYKISKTDGGVLVANVLPNSPAQGAGLQAGDLIQSVGNVKTNDVEVLRSTVAAMAPGTKTTLSIRRAGEEKKLELTVAEQPLEVAAAGGAETSVNRTLGMAVQTLTPDLAENLGYPKDMKGIIVVEVAQGSPADRAGVKRNDVILEVNRKPVANAAEFQEATKEIPERGVVFLVHREAGNQLIVVRPPAETPKQPK